MANETNYTFNEIVIYKEASAGVIPTTPSALKISGMINYSVKDTQKTETNPTLSSGGQASKKDRGTSDFAGNIENKMIGDIMPFIATHVIGVPTRTDATAAVWAAGTVYSLFDPYALTGDMINHSDGVHTLVCKIGGTSDATAEPVITGVANNGTVVDGTVTWIVRNKIFKYVGQSLANLTTFGTEYKSTSLSSGSAVDFIKRIEGNFLNSYEIAKSNGIIIHKYSLPVIAMSSDDNVSNTAFVSVKATTGYSEVAMNELPFGYDDLKIVVGGAEPVNGRNFRMTINRNTAIEDAIAQSTKVYNTPQMTVDGEIQLKFTKEQYLSAFNNDVVVIKAQFGKINGDIAHFTFNEVAKDRVDVDFSTNEPAYLTIPITASGDSVTPTLNYIIYSEIAY